MRVKGCPALKQIKIIKLRDKKGNLGKHTHIHAAFSFLFCFCKIIYLFVDGVDKVYGVRGDPHLQTTSQFRRRVAICITTM